jgi:hypothetical protein
VAPVSARAAKERPMLTYSSFSAAASSSAAVRAAQALDVDLVGTGCRAGYLGKAFDLLL